MTDGWFSRNVAVDETDDIKVLEDLPRSPALQPGFLIFRLQFEGSGSDGQHTQTGDMVGDCGAQLLPRAE